MFFASLQISFSTNGAIFTNSRLNPLPVHGVSVSQKPNLCMFKKPKFVVSSSLPDGGAGNHSTISGLLEKDFKFSPTFDEYLKVLESVRTDRSRVSGEEGDVRGLKKKSVRRDASKAGSVREKKKFTISKVQPSKEKVRDTKYTRGNTSDRRHGVAEKSISAWTMVEGILEKKTKEKRDEQWRRGLERRKSDDDFDGGRNAHKKIKGAGKVVDDMTLEKRKHGEPRENREEIKRLDDFDSSQFARCEMGHMAYDKRSNSSRIVCKTESSSRWDKRKTQDYYRRSKVKDLEIERNQSDHEGVLYTSVKEISHKEGRRNVKLSGDSLEAEKPKRGPESLRRSGRQNLETERNQSDHEGVLYTPAKEISHKEGRSNVKLSGDSIEAEKPKRGLESSRRSGGQNLEIERSKVKSLETERNQSDHEGVLHTSAKENSHKEGRSYVKLSGDSIEAEKPNRGLESLRRSGRTAVAYPYVSEGNIDGLDLEDRTAFRTFEEFTDVRNRPRVLRMELEERIMGLAKWLNASNLNMPEWQFSKMIHSAKIKFSEHSILRIVQILGSLGNWRCVLQVIEWFHSRERFKYYKSRYIYTTALDVLGKAKRPVEALNIFYAMRQQLSSYPDLAAYHCIAVTLGQAGLMKELFDVIDCMRAVPDKKFDLGPLQKWDPRLEPDLVVYNAVLNACVQQKQWEGVFWVLQELNKQGIRPSSTTYGLIMEVMLACGKYNLVHEFFRKSQKNSIPGALNYKVLINTYWREGKVEEAVQAVMDMERRGIVGSASLYYDLARCLCSAGRCLEALQQVKKISKVAKKPLVVTYTGLIQACLDTENIENASYIFSQMKNFCSPNVITCNIMLKSYVKHGMFEDAKSLFQNILAGSHEINNKAELSQKVFPDKFTFNTMMEACASASMWDDFENSYREMLHHGYHFDEKRHMRLVFDAWRAGKKHILEVTRDHMVSNGRIPPPAIIKELFCMKMEEDEPAAAISFITIHDMEIKAFSQKSWLNLLQIKAHSIRSKSIDGLSNEIRSIISENASSHPIYQNLLNACKEFTGSSGEPILLCNSKQKSQ